MDRDQGETTVERERQDAELAAKLQAELDARPVHEAPDTSAEMEKYMNTPYK